MTQDELKQLVAAAAADHVVNHLPEGAVIGVGTGSTANLFIEALAKSKSRFRGAVSSSLGSTARLEAHGFGQEKPIDTNDTDAGRQANRRVEFKILDEEDDSKAKK